MRACSVCRRACVFVSGPEKSVEEMKTTQGDSGHRKRKQSHPRPSKAWEAQERARRAAVREEDEREKEEALWGGKC